MDPASRARTSTQGAASRRRTRWQVIAVLVLALATLGAVALLR
jgi:hypothetical protein